MFANDAFSIVDRFNDGFLKRGRANDNICVLQVLVQRHSCLRKSLFICFVDFHLVNKHISFFQVIKSGFHGQAINTLRSLEKKTNFRVTICWKLSSLIKNQLGVHQGGMQARHYFENTYRKISNIRRTSVGNKIVDHSDVIGASPVGAAPTTSSFST